MGRIGIYGGTFNPPHRGHMQAARQAVELLNLDKLCSFGPCSASQNHAGGDACGTGASGAGASDGPGDSRAEASDLELLREGRSYTADTVELLHRTYPGDELFLLMGTDMFLAFPQWREPEKICRYATLVVMLREREEPKLQQELQAQAQHIRKKLDGKVKFLKNEALPMASTDVRRMLTFRRWAIC